MATRGLVRARIVGFDLKTVREDYYFEYSSNLLGVNSSLEPETLEVLCIVSCLEKLGKHRCLASHGLQSGHKCLHLWFPRLQQLPDTGELRDID